METAILADVRDLLNGHLDGLLYDLVAAESVNPPGREAVAAEVLARHLGALGVETRLQTFQDGRSNLVAPAAAWGRTVPVAFCSHLDVVPIGPPDDWSSPPFTLTEVDGRLFGRGVCDAKGPLAVMALVLTAIERHLANRVAVAAVAGEEAGGVGSRALLDEGFRAGATIIGEPTGMQVARAHKGRVEANITVRGAGRHAAMPTEERTALDRLPPVLSALQQYASDLAGSRTSVCGPPTFAVTKVTSGDGNAATVPATISLTVDRRLVPGERHEEAAAELGSAVRGLDAVSLSWHAGADPCELPAGHPLVTAAVAADPYGRRPIGLSATCDQYLWDRAGIPGVVLGPGDLLSNRAHAADEFIDRVDLLTAGEQYARSVLRYLETL